MLHQICMHTLHSNIGWISCSVHELQQGYSRGLQQEYLDNLKWSAGLGWQTCAIHLALILPTSTRADHQCFMVVVPNAAGLKGDFNLLLHPCGACWGRCHRARLALKCSRALPSERGLVICLLCQPMLKAKYLSKQMLTSKV